MRTPQFRCGPGDRSVADAGNTSPVLSSDDSRPSSSTGLPRYQPYCLEMEHPHGEHPRQCKGSSVPAANTTPMQRE